MVDDKQSLGGKARAASLTAAERKAIAQKAANSRWNADIPQALEEGEFPLGASNIACAVIDDGSETRVITQATFLRAIGRSRSPKAGTGVLSTVDDLPFFLQAEALKPFISNELKGSTKPIFYRSKAGGKGVGYDAKLLPMVAEVYLKFRDHHLAENGEVPSRYAHIVVAADALMRGLAHVGIIALVDEATGYQETRAKNALAEIFRQFLTDERQKWSLTFPLDFYKEIYRLRGWKFEPWNTRRPSVVAKWTDNFVYDRLAPGITKELREKNPVSDTERRSFKHHQWFNPASGHPALKEHISGVIALLRAADDWQSFRRGLDRAYKKYGDNYDLDLHGGKDNRKKG